MKRSVVGVVDRLQVFELLVWQNRGFRDQSCGMAQGLLEQIELGAEAGFQRHHDLLAKRVDGGVGDLGELLPEVVVKGPGPAGHHRQRRVVAHRADRFLPDIGQHPQHLLAFLVTDVEHLLVAPQVLARERLPLRHPVVDQGTNMPGSFVQPLPVRVPGAVDAVDLVGGQELARAGVGRQHFARPQPPLVHHVGILEFVHPDFGGQHDAPVPGDDITGRPQSVSVQDAGGITAIGQHDAGRAVPRLHVHGTVLVERPQVRIHLLRVLPGRRNQQAHRPEDVDAPGMQDFQHVVQRTGVRTFRGNQRPQLLKAWKMAAVERVRPGLGPVAIAPDGVDLAVVRQVAERLRQRPLRQRIGGEPLVENANRGGQLRIVEVGVEVRQPLRHHQALVADYAGRQAADVEIRVIRHRPLRLPPCQQQRRIAMPGVTAEQIDEQLLDARHRSPGLFSEHLRINRHLPPATRPEPLLGQIFFEGFPARLRASLVPAQEYHAQRVVLAKFDAVAFCDRPEIPG